MEPGSIAAAPIPLETPCPAVVACRLAEAGLDVCRIVGANDGFRHGAHQSIVWPLFISARSAVFSAAVMRLPTIVTLGKVVTVA